MQHTSDRVKTTPEFAPVRIAEIELGQPLPTLTALNTRNGSLYQRAQCLVRLHGHSLGIVELAFQQHELRASDYVPQIWEALHERIVEHMQQDGLTTPTNLDQAGIVSTQTPACLMEREAFVAQAPFVSIIVSTHDRTEQLAQTLPALLALQYPRYELIIVDNAPSANDTAQLVQQTYGHIPYLRYVREDLPGLSHGLNRGIQEAHGEILAFTDDDVLVDGNWLLYLAKAFGQTEDVVCVTGLVLPQELETPAQCWFEEYGGFSKGFLRRIYDMREHRPPEPLFPYTAGRFGTGASMAFRATFLRYIGGFDPALQAGMDITAFFEAIIDGHRLVYEPAALAHHIHRRSDTELERQLYSYGVALTAYLTGVILKRPRLIFDLMLKVPYGLFFALSTKSPKNTRKSAQYPYSLTRAERKGLLYGPGFYLRRRRTSSAAGQRPKLAQEHVVA